jgi:hypothetical protein
LGFALTGALTAAEVTVDVVTPIVKSITGVLVDATVKVNALVGVDADIVLATVDGTARITVSALAQLVATLIIVSECPQVVQTTYAN